MAVDALENARNAQIQAASGKKGEDDPAGGENAPMELLTSAANRAGKNFGKVLLGSEKAGLLTAGLSGTAIYANFEKAESLWDQKIRGLINDLNGGMLAKLWAALTKGGIAIVDLTGGVGGSPLLEGLATGSEKFEVAQASFPEFGGFVSNISADISVDMGAGRNT